MKTIQFENAPGLGAEVSEVKPFCKLLKNMEVPTWQDIVGDFEDPSKPGLAGRKFSRLCGFTFKTKVETAPSKTFQIVYVPKLKGSISRNDRALSGWYCWTVVSNIDRRVTSIADMKKVFKFDVNKFFHTDYFEKWLKVFKSNISWALQHQVKELVEKSVGTPEYKELARHVNAVADSLELIDEVQKMVTPDNAYDDSDAPDYAKGSAPKVGHAKIAYNADKTYGLKNLDQNSQRKEEFRRSLERLASKQK